MTARLLELWPYTPVLLLVLVAVAVIFGRAVVRAVVGAAAVAVFCVWAFDNYHAEAVAQIVHLFPDMPRGWLP